MIVRYAGRILMTALLLSSTGCSVAMAQGECSWEKRASLPAPVQRYLSYIFQNSEDRYRPYRFSVDDYLRGVPGITSRRVDRFEEIPKDKPYSLYQSNSNFPTYFLQFEAGTPAPFESYWSSNRALSNYTLDGYDAADLAGIGPVSFVGFDPRHHASADAQARKIADQNPRYFNAGKYVVENAVDGCLIVTQSSDDGLTALLTIYDGEQAIEENLRQRNFLKCRDRHYARFLGLRYWPARPYSRSEASIPAPEYDYSGAPFAPPAGTGRPAASSSSLRFLPYAPSGAWEVEKSADATKIIALEGSGDFSGVCKTAMDLYHKRLPRRIYEWANERHAK